MNDLEKSFKSIVRSLCDGHGDPYDLVEEYWQAFKRDAKLSSPAHMEPSKWTQVKPVGAGLYRNWSPERRVMDSANFKSLRGRLVDCDNDGVDMYDASLWWLRIEDVVPPIQEGS